MQCSVRLLLLRGSCCDPQYMTLIYRPSKSERMIRPTSSIPSPWLAPVNGSIKVVDVEHGTFITHQVILSCEGIMGEKVIEGKM